MIVRTVAALSLLALTGCATAPTAASYAKPGFVTEVRDGRLWVFRAGSKDLEEFHDYLVAR